MTIFNPIQGSFVKANSIGIGIVAHRKGRNLIILANDCDRWVEEDVTQVRRHSFAHLNPTSDPDINWQIYSAIRDERHIKEGKRVGKTPPSYWFPRMLDDDYQKLHPNQELINQLTAMMYHVARNVPDLDYPTLACVLLDHMRVSHRSRTEVLSQVLHCDHIQADDYQKMCHLTNSTFTRVRTAFVKWYACEEQPQQMPKL